MDMNALFTAALGLQSPWTVTELTFDAARKRLDLRVDFAPGSTFPCETCRKLSKVHDAPEHEWRHLNFFEHQTYLKARQPRVKCDEHGVRQVSVPWARPGSGFTLLFEAFVLELARAGMPVAGVARIVGEHDTTLWRIIEHHVADALQRQKLDGVTKVGVDETSRARGHNYLTLFADLALARVIFIALERDNETVKQFREWLTSHGGDPAAITDFSLDMSPAFIKGVEENFPKAELTFDKFHVIKLANEAVEKVRREEQKKLPELKRTRWLWLRNEKDLSDEQRSRLADVRVLAKRTARAYRYRLELQELYALPDHSTAEAYFQRWFAGAVRSRLAPIRQLARTLRDHIKGVLRWFESRVTNGLLEGLSSLVQASKAAARGYRNPNYMATMIYLRLSKLDITVMSTLRPASI